jgi:hypothetical protein
MNAEDRNAVRQAMHEALSGKSITLENPHATAKMMLAAAAELQVEHTPRYDGIHGRMTGPHRVTFERGSDSHKRSGISTRTPRRNPN